MSASKSILFFGVFLLFEGVVLLLAPNILLSLARIPQTNEVWIRFLGLVFLILGYYYIRASKKNFSEFFAWTVHARIFQFLVVCGFVLFRLISPVILLFSGFELLCGVWTWWVLRSER